jgi:transcriptional regulator with XRE-family HTH domain
MKELILLFYDNYVRLCNSVGKTPSAVATEIGIQKSTVSRWSKGSAPNYATAMKVADYFGVPIDPLFNEFDWEGFGVNLNSYSDSFGISVDDIAKAVGVKVETVRNWIEFKEYPKMDMIEKVAKYLGIEKDDLIENRSVDFTVADYHARPDWMDKDTHETVKKYLKLSDDQKRIINDTMDVFLKTRFL